MKKIFISLLYLTKLVCSQNTAENNAKYKCGVRKVNREPGVEKESELGAWPWTVLILVDQKDGKSYISGTIISDFYILTSKGIDQSISKTYIYSAQNDVENKNAIPLTVVRVIDHPDPNIMLSLLELDHPLTFSPLNSPICLPESNDSSIVFNQILTLTGWYSIF